MQSGVVQTIVDATFRANPNYELVLFDHLSAEEQRALADLRQDPELYGILRPRDGTGLSIKAVGRDTALLYWTLRRPGPLPGYVKAALGDECNRAIAQMVLDGILDIECGDGDFVSGAAAHTLIYAGETISATAHGKIARLSREALQYAQALSISDSVKLSARLYFYNRVPVSPSWKSLFPNRESVIAFLGVRSGRPPEAAFRKSWSRFSTSMASAGWLMWHSRSRRSEDHNGAGTYKLYISPACDAVRDAFAAVVEVLAESPARELKIGNDVYGLLRPDKIVAYFTEIDEMRAAASQLERRLQDCPGHGVPFSAELTENGLLSWGIDPPSTTAVLSWQERESWRLWVTNRLAAALVFARSQPPSAVPPWQFAVDRLRLEGVDTDTWTPTSALAAPNPAGDPHGGDH